MLRLWDLHVFEAYCLLGGLNGCGLVLMILKRNVIEKNGEGESLCLRSELERASDVVARKKK